jgi:hypothetical protein
LSREGVQAIEIELRRGDVIVERAEGDDIRLQATFTNGAGEADLQSLSEGGTLRIRQHPGSSPGDAGNFFNDFGLGAILSKFGRIDLRVGLPAGFQRIAVSTGLGTVRVSGSEADLQIKSGKGDLLVNGGTGHAVARTGAGVVRAEGFHGSLEGHTGMGEVAIVRVEGAARLHTGMGKVTVSDSALTLDANTGMGEVTLTRASGRAKVRTGMGNVGVTEGGDLELDADTGKGQLTLDGRFGAIRAKTGDGDVRLRAAALRGASEVGTGRGGIELILPGQTAVRIDASTGRGRVESATPLLQVGQPGPSGFFSNRLVGAIGTGEIQASLKARTGFGNIRISVEGSEAMGQAPEEARASRGAAASAETSAVAASSVPNTQNPVPNTRLEILQALGRGEITIDEAERRLAQA